MRGFSPATRRCLQWPGRLAQLVPLSILVTPVVLARAVESSKPTASKNVAVITTAYFHNSHADVIASRLLQTDTLDGKGKDSALKLVSLYTDQRPANDISRWLAASHHFRVSQTIEDALTLGT